MFPCLTSHISGAITSCHQTNGLLPHSAICLFRCLMVHMLPSRGTPLLYKVEKLSQTALRCNNNTHMETFGEHSDNIIFNPEFLFHMKHMGYFSSTMKSYMVSLKYDFEEFWSKHWLYTDTFKWNKSKMDHKGKQKSLHWLPTNQINS